MSVQHLRLKAARLLVVILWLHLPVVAVLAYGRAGDPIVPLALGFVLVVLATAATLRRSFSPLGAVLVACAYGGSVVLMAGLMEGTPWQTARLAFTGVCMALTLPLCSAPAVLVFGVVVLIGELGPSLWFGAFASDPTEMLLGAGLLAVAAGVLASLARAMAQTLQHAQAAATAAKETAEGLWQERTTAQILQAQFVAALVDRITALAQDPLSPSPPATAFPFAYAEVERAVDLLAQKLRQGCGWGELSWLAGHAPFDLATALTHLTGCLQDQSARLHKASQAAQLDYSAKLLHKIRLDLADLTDQTQQTATFAADLSQAVHAYAKTPPLPRLFAVTQSRPNGIAPVSEPGVQRSPVLTALTWQGDQAASRAA